MYWIAGGFVFRKVESPFHSLDPRVKLLVSIEFFAISLIAFSVFQLVTVISAMLMVGFVARILKRIGRTLLLSGSFAGFIFVVNLVFRQSLFYSGIYSVRFLAIIVSTSLFFVTTSPDELEQVMKGMHLPRDVIFAFVTAVRFIPVIMLDAIQIMDAQRSRGLEMQKGNLIGRVRKMVPILVPLVVSSVIRSGELAEAMESRAYGAVPRPTSLYNPRATARDKAVAILSLVLLSLTLYIYLYVPVAI